MAASTASACARAHRHTSRRQARTDCSIPTRSPKPIGIYINNRAVPGRMSWIYDLLKRGSSLDSHGRKKNFTCASSQSRATRYLWLHSTEFRECWMSNASGTTAEKAYAHAIPDAPCERINLRCSQIRDIADSWRRTRAGLIPPEFRIGHGRRSRMVHQPHGILCHGMPPPSDVRTILQKHFSNVFRE
jgi:hypothetical protein